jgi:heme exporter protein A
MSLFEASRLVCVRSERPVFAGLGFAIAAGGALVLVGRNGCGKSSLIRLMAGLLPAVGGEMRWAGRPVAADWPAHQARIGFVGHADALKPALTVAENLAFWAAYGEPAGEPPGEPAAERVTRALAAFDIARLADVPGRFLSAGQRRRLALARLLVRDVPLWLLDEPRTALDHDAVHGLDRAIARHREAGGLVVLALHGGAHPPGAAVLDVGRFAAPPGAAAADGEAGGW